MHEGPVRLTRYAWLNTLSDGKQNKNTGILISPLGPKPSDIVRVTYYHRRRAASRPLDKFGSIMYLTACRSCMIM